MSELGVNMRFALVLCVGVLLAGTSQAQYHNSYSAQSVIVSNQYKWNGYSHQYRQQYFYQPQYYQPYYVVPKTTIVTIEVYQTEDGKWGLAVKLKDDVQMKAEKTYKTKAEALKVAEAIFGNTQKVVVVEVAKKFMEEAVKEATKNVKKVPPLSKDQVDLLKDILGDGAVEKLLDGWKK